MLLLILLLIFILILIILILIILILKAPLWFKPKKCWGASSSKGNVD